ncbi:hypothetical protein N0V83_002802 [Neocucurbitaria cava]|uniref:Uncharacterized protein n=1 Tax=Neocucurbitaria cava TaxID=798079 RepID=A0A9W8YEC6_9PLEO|nr:hypothetical protein N0V83_002802 [Neocucurbitaria cava]
MSRPLTTLGNRLRTATISLPIINRTPQRPFSFDTATSKARAAQWEPNLPSLDALLSVKQQQQDDVDDQDGGEKDQDGDLPMMTTYGAFDPGASRPLMLHSGVGVAVPSIADVYLRDVVPGGDRGRGRAITVGEKAVTIKDKVVTTTATTTTAVTLPNKPWPYRLPAFLQPGVGTTFEMMHHATTTTTTLTPTTSTAAAPAPASHESNIHGYDKAPQRIRISILQAILYGVPEPEKFSFAKTVVREGGVVHKILYGVKDHEGTCSGGVGVAVAVGKVVGVAETETETETEIAGEEARVVVDEKTEKIEEVVVVGK